MIICTLLQLYLFIVFARVLMSWVPPTPGSGYAQVYSMVYNATEPVLAPVRRVIPPMRVGMAAIDLSVIVVLLGGQILLGNIC